MRWALIQDGIVENILVADETFLEAAYPHHDRVELSGDVTCDVGWTWNGVGFAPPFISIALEAPLGLPEAIAIRQAEVASHASHLLERATQGYSEREMVTWLRKEQEAKAFLDSGDPSDAPNLAMEAHFAGRPVGEVAQTVVMKSVALNQYNALIVGVRWKHQARSRSYPLSKLSCLTTTSAVGAGTADAGRN
ncbi:MAG: hypothetical protein HC781_06375 [Leptolyngbyaceae cyanobacterium CSU_1_4]|nr:hypothetical protein [Leptolyngbyaceae cyanobacterium CSU_1_4]